MSDDASETVGGGVRAFLGSAGFLTMMFGGYYFYEGKGPGPWWMGYFLIAIGLPLFVLPALWKKLRGKPATPAQKPLGYLRDENANLGPAIRDMAWLSAWGKWYAAQQLATAHRYNETELMHVADSAVSQALVNGHLKARGRRPGQLSYEDIPPEHWHSTIPHMIPSGPWLWKMILIPTGGAEFKPDGTIIGHDAAATERTAQLQEYDSIIINAREFEKLWPRKEARADAGRKRYLKQAKKAGVDIAEIEKLRRD